MTNGTMLVVPIDVQALCIGAKDTAAGAKTLLPTADFSALPHRQNGTNCQTGPYTSVAVLAAGGPLEGEQAFLPGIHLHWALPDGLTHAPQGSDPTTPGAFPAVPNRWLVTRIVLDTGNPAHPALKSWVVESDRLSTAQTTPAGLYQPTVPLDPSESPGFRYIGKATDASVGWAEPGKLAVTDQFAPLTAVGYGEESFASFYPNCSTVFGHYDDLADLIGYNPATSTVAYHVAGWYGNPADEPLAADPTGARFGWRIPQGAAPAATVLSGIIDDIA